MAWLALDDLAIAVTIDGLGRLRLIPGGPLGPDEARCDDARCVAGRIVEWVLAWRAGAQQAARTR